MAGTDARRLIAGDFDGTRGGPLGVRLAVDGARVVDWTLARLNVARPVVLVSGFWRSGTTWMQECLAEALAAKTVFEPLSPLDPRRRAMLVARGLPYDSLQAAMPGPLAEDDPLWGFLDHACTGRHTSQLHPELPHVAAGVLRDAHRGQGCADALQPRRLPSALRCAGAPPAPPPLRRRGEPARRRLGLELLAGGAGRPAPRLQRPRRRAARLRRRRPVPHRGLVGRDGAPRRGEPSGRPWAHHAVYEDVVTDPGPAFAALCDRLGLPQRRAPRFARRSASTVGTPAPRDRWRSSLSRSEIARVGEIVTRLHPGCLEAWGGRPN